MTKKQKKLFKLTRRGYETWHIRAESKKEFIKDIEKGWKITEVKE